MTLNNMIYQKLNSIFNENDARIFYVTDKSFYYKTEKNTYFIKENEKKIDQLFSYLMSLNVSSINYPIQKFKIEKNSYLIFEYLDNIYHPDTKKIIELKNALQELHNKTETKRILSSKNFKYLKRVYQKLDYKFKMLELYQRSIETKKIKDDYDWIILSKYHIFLDAKKELFHMQRKIHQDIKNKLSVIYVINHGNPKLSHLINNKLISINKSKLGVVSSDIAKMYIENEHINIDWFNEINDWLKSYDNNFYKTYFKFLVLYIYILNLNISLIDDDYKINNYVRISEKIKKFLDLFYSYH